MLPKTEHCPACLYELKVAADVALSISSDLCGPKLGVRCCGPIVIDAAMPEASVDENGDPDSRENNVGFQPAILGQRCVVDSIAETCGKD